MLRINEQIVDGVLKKLWISRDEKVKPLNARQFPITYEQSYPQVFVKEFRHLTEFRHELRQYLYSLTTTLL